MNHILTKERANQAGFTIIEILIVILIIAVFAGIVSKSWSYLKQAKFTATESNLKTVKDELRRYNEHVHKYPDTLTDLVRKPVDITTNRQWGGPYFGDEVEGNIEVPKDGWGNDFVYRPTPGSQPPYVLYSWGPNGPDSPTEEHVTV